MTLGQRIKNHRKEHGLSQEKLAAMMYVTRQSVSQWETDKTMPSVDLLMRLSEIFGVTVDNLLGKDEPAVECKPIASSRIITDKKRLKQCRRHFFLSSTVIIVSSVISLFVYIILNTSIFPKAFEGIRYKFDTLTFKIIFAAALALLAAAIVFTVYSMIIYKSDLRYFSIFTEIPVVRFFDDGFTLNDNSDSPICFNYTNLKRVFETDNYIILFTDGKRRIYIDKNEIDGDADRLHQVLRGCTKYRRKLICFRGKKQISEKAAVFICCAANSLLVFSVFSIEYAVLLKARIMTDAELPFAARWVMVLLPYFICGLSLVAGVILIIRRIKAVRLIIAGTVTICFLLLFTIVRMPFYTFQQHRVMPDEFKSYMESHGFDVKLTNKGRTELFLMDSMTATSKERGYEIVYYNFLDLSDQDGHVYAAELYNKCVTETKMFARYIKNSNYLNLMFNSYFTAETEDKYCYVSLNKYSIIYIMTDIENKDDISEILHDYKMPLPY